MWTMPRTSRASLSLFILCAELDALRRVVTVLEARLEANDAADTAAALANAASDCSSVTTVEISVASPVSAHSG